MKDKQFLVIGFSLIDNKHYRKIMTSSKGIEMTYQWLRRNVVRAPMMNKYANYVYKNYFLKGILAVSINTDQLSKSLFLSKPTVLKNLDILHKEGLIKIDNLDTSRGGNQNPQRAYKLGKWLTEIDTEGNEKYNEFFYAFDIISREEMYGKSIS